MLNASVGVQRVIGRLRRPRDDRQTGARAIQIGSLAAAHRCSAGSSRSCVASRLMPERDQALVVEQPVGDPRRPILWRSDTTGRWPSRSPASSSAPRLSACPVARPVPRPAAPPVTDRLRGSRSAGAPTTAPGASTTAHHRRRHGRHRRGRGLVGTVEFGEPNAPQTPATTSPTWTSATAPRSPNRSTSRARSSMTAR